jgi:hypothetical protein
VFPVLFAQAMYSDLNCRLGYPQLGGHCGVRTAILIAREEELEAIKVR